MAAPAPALHDKAEDVKAFFKTFDKNGDGTISKDEMKSIFTEFSDSEIDTMIKGLDSNKDGVIQYEEFTNWVMAVGGVTTSMMQMGEPVIKQDSSVDAAIKEMFEEVDLDKNGHVTLEESLKMAKMVSDKFRQPYDESQVKESFSMGDLNKDGKVTLDEFKKFCQSQFGEATNEQIFSTIKMLNEMFKVVKAEAAKSTPESAPEPAAESAPAS
jgi:Ca2+-binding EF-hand superfamily protein